MTEDYYFWEPGTKVRVTSGDYKGLEGEIGAYDPMSDTPFLVFFDDKKNMHKYAVSDLEEVTVDSPIKNEPTSKKIKATCFECGSKDNVVPSLDKDKLVDKCLKCRKSEIDSQLNPDEITIDNELPLDTLMRLAERKKGVTLSELVSERKSKAKGPFVKTIKSALKKKLIRRTKANRNQENVYIVRKDPSVREEERESKIRKEQSIQESEPIQKILKNSNREDLGDLFIAIGKLLKNQ